MARATIDPDQLPKHFDAAEAEKRWDARWQELGVYRYDPSRRREETWVVDTPPPTTSGTLHIGHIFSYTQTDIVTRYQRMRGKSVYYPMGWDDNGVPTERRAEPAQRALQPGARARHEPRADPDRSPERQAAQPTSRAALAAGFHRAVRARHVRG